MSSDFDDFIDGFEEDELDIISITRGSSLNESNVAKQPSNIDNPIPQQIQLESIEEEIDSITDSQIFGIIDHDNQTHKLNEDALTTYVYPVNYELRDYQFNIVKKSLFSNVLCALPTGLGKTFIASTVMLNWYRWTESAKIIFMAPTRPLVSQQIKACLGITGIPNRDTAVLMGSRSVSIREEAWTTKRVFFATPQTVQNDLSRGILDPKSIVCLVVDEAHRATGNYAYTKVIQLISKVNKSFRVLALTATPASTVEGVQEVIDNLMISTVEIRTEESMDLQKYMHLKIQDMIEVPLNGEVEEIIDYLAIAIKPLLTVVNKSGVYHVRDPKKINSFTARQSLQIYARRSGGNSGAFFKARAIMQIIGVAAYAISLLTFHSIRSFYNYFAPEYFNFKNSKSKGKFTGQFYDDKNVSKAIELAQEVLGRDDYVGHPKQEKLTEVMLDFFKNSKNKDSKAIVFSSFRESANDIVRVLDRHGPLLRPHIFLGQAVKQKKKIKPKKPTKTKRKGKDKRKPKKKRRKSGAKKFILDEVDDDDDDGDEDNHEEEDEEDDDEENEEGSEHEHNDNNNNEIEEEERPNVTNRNDNDKYIKRFAVNNRSSERTASSDFATENGMNQKLQHEVIHRFLEGNYNILVATSVGEEGLDIGEVDLIVNYDSNASAIRGLQRMGRTGRKRDGHVAFLFSGNENEKHKKAIDNHQFIQKKITSSNSFKYVKSERIIPNTIAPTCEKKCIIIPRENEEIIQAEDDEVIEIAVNKLKTPRGKRKKAEKKFYMPDNALTKFIKASKLVQAQSLESSSSSKSYHKSSPQRNLSSDIDIDMGVEINESFNHSKNKKVVLKEKAGSDQFNWDDNDNDFDCDLDISVLLKTPGSSTNKVSRNDDEMVHPSSNESEKKTDFPSSPLLDVQSLSQEKGTGNNLIEVLDDDEGNNKILIDENELIELPDSQLFDTTDINNDNLPITLSSTFTPLPHQELQPKQKRKKFVSEVYGKNYGCLLPKKEDELLDMISNSPDLYQSIKEYDPLLGAQKGVDAKFISHGRTTSRFMNAVKMMGDKIDKSIEYESYLDPEKVIELETLKERAEKFKLLPQGHESNSNKFVFIVKKESEEEDIEIIEEGKDNSPRCPVSGFGELDDEALRNEDFSNLNWDISEDF